MADTTQLSALRTYLEEITHTANDATFPGSTYELQLLNQGYMEAVYRHWWPQSMRRWFDPVVAYVDRYSLQSDFRRMQFMRSQNQRLEPTDIDHIYEGGFREFAVTLDSNEYIIGEQPDTATTIYTTSGSLTAGSAVVVTLSSVTGISQGDELFFSDGASSEFTKVQSVDSVGITVTVKIANSHNSGINVYRTAEGNYMAYQKKITLLSATTDIMILPGETHLIVPHFSAALYYDDIEEPDRALTHQTRFETKIDEAWLAWGHSEAGAVGQFTL